MERLTKLKVLVVLLFYPIIWILNANAQPASDITPIEEEHILKKIEKTYNVKSGGDLTIVSEFGTIDVQTAQQDKVEAVIIFIPADSSVGNVVGNNNVVNNVVIINGKVQNGSKSKLDPRVKEAVEDFEVTFEHKDADVRIEGKFKRGRKHWRKELNRLKILFQLTVPRQYNLDLVTSSGGVSVADLDGDVRAKNSAGSLRFGKIKGTVWGHTSAGSIKLTSCDSTVDVKTSSGSIKAGNVVGNVQAQTSSGSIRLDSVGGTVNARTSSGSIRVSLAGQPREACSLHTSAGSITVNLMSDIEVDVDAETSAGRISTELAVASVIQGKMPKNRLKGSINGGGPLLKLRTSAGSIRLQKAAD